MNQQIWDAKQYQDNASFVSELGSSVLELLNPQHGEVILDLGCGDGSLTEKIAYTVKEVIGIDSSKSMVEATRKRGLNADLLSGDFISYKNKFDAVFSNALLHWLSDYQAVIKGVHQALKPKGRFVGEFGGQGNISTLVHVMQTVVNKNKTMGDFSNPWFFPSVDKYKAALEDGGFSVAYIELIPRPTPLKTGVQEWVKIFANHIISGMPESLESEFLTQTEALARPHLFSESSGWAADYVRLKFHATKT